MRDDITSNMAGLFNNNGVAEKMQDLRNRQTDRWTDKASYRDSLLHTKIKIYVHNSILLSIECLKT